MALFLPLLEALEREKISYVIVGGLAVVLHGHGRLTTDMDLVVGLDTHNAAKIIDVLVSLGYGCRVPEDPKGFADPQTRARWIAEKGLTVFSFYDKSNSFFGVDLFVDYPLDFQQLCARSVLKPIGPIQVRIASIDDLIFMKRKAGRPKDLEDIRMLEMIKNVQP